MSKNTKHTTNKTQKSNTRRMPAGVLVGGFGDEVYSAKYGRSSSAPVVVLYRITGI